MSYSKNKQNILVITPISTKLSSAMAKSTFVGLIQSFQTFVIYRRCLYTLRSYVQIVQAEKRTFNKIGINQLDVTMETAYFKNRHLKQKYCSATSNLVQKVLTQYYKTMLKISKKMQFRIRKHLHFVSSLISSAALRN